MSTLQVRFSPYLGSASSRPSQKVDLGAVRYLHSVVKRCSSKGRPAPRERSLEAIAAMTRVRAEDVFHKNATDGSLGEHTS